MTRQVIATGSAANDGTGDTLRSASQKINENFAEVYTFLGGSSSALSSQITLEDSAIVFEGSIDDGFETRLTAVNATGARQIQLPNASGIAIVDTATQTLTNKTLTSPQIGTAILDTNGNEEIKFTATSSAVNEITVANAATGNAPSVTASGTNTNINLNVNAKGNGSVKISKIAVGGQSTSNSTAPVNDGYLNYTSAAGTIIVNDGTTLGEQKVFTNTTGGAITIQPTNFAQGTSISLADNGGVTLIWNTTEWFIIGHYGATVS